MIKITIIMPIYNCVHYTKHVVTQIYKYTSNAYELILIDNGSSDETIGLLKSYRNDDNVTVIKNTENMGYAYANNQGIQKAESEYLCFLNNDVLLYPDWDIDLLRPFSQYNDIGATGPVTNNCAGVQCGDYTLQNIGKESYSVIAKQRSKELANNFREYHRIIGFCLMAKTQLIKEIRGFDESYNIGNYEDDDLCLRILLSKHKIIICENAFIYHFGSQTFKKNNIDHLNSLKINAKLFADKWSVRLEDNGGYTYDINKLNNKNIKNKNYLTNSKSVPDMIRKPPKCATLGHLKKINQLIAKRSHHEVETEYKNLLKIRPFHPEATLQLIDYYLENNTLDKAEQYTSELCKMTPAWPLVKKLVASFDHSLLVNIKHNNRENEKISFCLITKDEQVNIERCLKSLNKVKNKQIIIVDTGSSDNTIKIAKTFGAEIYHHEWNNDFSEARNQSLEYARGDWVMFLDADEELTSDAVQTLKEDMTKPNILGYRLPLENVGSPLHGCNYVPRLVRNAPGLYFIGKIHETIHASVLVVMKQWNMDQVIGKTKILHHGYKPEELEKKNKVKRNLALYEEALEELPDEPSIMMNYAHDLNHDGQNERAYKIYKKILEIFEQYEKENITPEVREQFIHNYGVFLAQHLKMKELSEVMHTRTARETGPVANVHYMAGLGLMNCNKFRKAIPELEASIEKAYDDTLAPSVPDIRTWKPKHLLANCHASVGNELEARMLWDEVIADCNDSVDPFHDYARFLSTLDRNKEALEILLKGLKIAGDTQKIWELGCGIVNKDPELAEMSLEWTEEALKHYPDSDVTNIRRGESLMKNGRFAEATDYFSRLSGRGEKTATAAQLVCRQ
ncbi:MAG: glycosyltransferase, partial [Kordiimonadaceae bacterium]|nr:glycosyltransferase [Kordiimonadaceae bacterium]